MVPWRELGRSIGAEAFRLGLAWVGHLVKEEEVIGACHKARAELEGERFQFLALNQTLHQCQSDLEIHRSQSLLLFIVFGLVCFCCGLLGGFVLWHHPKSQNKRARKPVRTVKGEPVFFPSLKKAVAALPIESDGKPGSSSTASEVVRARARASALQG